MLDTISRIHSGNCSVGICERRVRSVVTRSELDSASVTQSSGLGSVQSGHETDGEASQSKTQSSPQLAMSFDRFGCF